MPLPIYVIVPKLVVLRLKGVGINTGKKNKIGKPWNSTLLGWEARLIPRYSPLPHMCYHVNFGSCAIKGVRINRRELQKLLGVIFRPRDR